MLTAAQGEVAALPLPTDSLVDTRFGTALVAPPARFLSLVDTVQRCAPQNVYSGHSEAVDWLEPAVPYWTHGGQRYPDSEFPVVCATAEPAIAVFSALAPRGARAHFARPDGGVLFFVRQAALPRMRGAQGAVAFLNRRGCSFSNFFPFDGGVPEGWSMPLDDPGYVEMVHALGLLAAGTNNEGSDVPALPLRPPEWRNKRAQKPTQYAQVTFKEFEALLERDPRSQLMAIP